MEEKQNISELLEQMKRADEPRKQMEARKPQHPKARANNPYQSKQKTDQEIKRAYLGSLMGRRR